jgi:hypothetical protein
MTLDEIVSIIGEATREHLLAAASPQVPGSTTMPESIPRVQAEQVCSTGSAQSPRRLPQEAPTPSPEPVDRRQRRRHRARKAAVRYRRECREVRMSLSTNLQRLEERESRLLTMISQLRDEIKTLRAQVLAHPPPEYV